MKHSWSWPMPCLVLLFLLSKSKFFSHKWPHITTGPFMFSDFPPALLCVFLLAIFLDCFSSNLSSEPHLLAKWSTMPMIWRFLLLTVSSRCCGPRNKKFITTINKNKQTKRLDIVKKNLDFQQIWRKLFFSALSVHKNQSQFKRWQ